MNKLWHYLTIFFVLSITIVYIACHKDKTYIIEKPVDEYQPTPYQIEVPKFFPTKMNIPEDNPLTVEGIELGRYLFYDGQLSGRTEIDSLMSCATCHIQANSFECGINHPKFLNGKTFGLTGIPTPHYMMPLINLVWNEYGYLWNGVIHESNTDSKKRNIEALVWMGIMAPHEMNGDTNRTIALLRQNPIYPGMFKKAFGSEDITLDRVSKAIAQFIRTLISNNCKFDRYLRGEEQLTTSELNGFVLFTTEEGADCFHCHGGDGNVLFTTNLFYNNAKDDVFNDVRDRYHVTFDPMDIGAYRAPTLRNIALTAPYMHDGRFKTLDEVINFYNIGLVYSPYVHPLMHKINQGGADLTPRQKQDLKAFLLTLTDTTFINNPAFSNPWK